MKTRIYSLMLLTVLMLAACGGAVVPPSITPVTSPIESPVQTPVAQPPATIAPAPGGGLITKPESAKWNNAPQAALNARKLLVEQLKVDVDLIGLVSAEQVDWPDGCLGIQTPGVMCIQVITTGYRVVLSANGSEYEFHTNLSGDVVLPVPPAQ